MKNLIAVAIGTVPLLASRDSFAQDGHMAGSGMWGLGWMGGYGGVWVPILVVVLVAVLVVWVANRRGK